MKTVEMKVPEWFEQLGTRYDSTIGREFDIPALWVSSCRKALGIESYYFMKKKTGTLRKSARVKKYNRLRNMKIPRSAWADALGFVHRAGLTPNECLEEWLHCYKKGLHYNPNFPRKWKLRQKVNKAKAGMRLHRAPVGDPSDDLVDRDDESFNVGDV